MNTIKLLSLLHKYNLWCAYNSTYIEIQRNPRARYAMRNDPGVKWMRKGWRIVFGIIAVLALIGRM